MDTLELKIEKLETLITKLKALANPTRLQIIELLKTKGEMSVEEIVDNLGLEQSLVSHQLHNLNRCGILIFHRQGRSTFYAVNREIITEIEKCIML
jgi:ArsR family transcriptional regulator